MKRRFLALALALVMVVGLLPVLGVSADDQVENRLDLYSATQSTTSNDNAIPSYYVASTDTEPVKFAVDESDKYTATLSGTMAKSNTNYAALNFKDRFTSVPNVAEHVTQTIKIDNMPIFDEASFKTAFYASGYFNVLTRNYGAPIATPLPPDKVAGDCHDSIMYSIYCVDANGTLAMQIYYMGFDDNGAANYTMIPVPKFSEKLCVPFTLTTVWHADNKVTFICDDEELGTFDNATFAATSKVARREYLSIGYNGDGTTTAGPDLVNLTVSNVQISNGHTPDTDNSDCTTGIKCSVCGEVVTPSQPHNYNKKVPADAYKKADTEREYYLSCVCGATSEGTPYEATYTVFDLSPATQSTDKNVDNYNSVAYDTDTAVFSVSGHTAKLSGSMYTLKTARTSLNFKNVFSATGVDDHLSQTICFTTLPYIPSTKNPTTRFARGYYNLLTRNDDDEANTMDHLLYNITRIDNNEPGYLQLNVYTSVEQNATPGHTIALGKKLGDTFVLTTVWHADDGVTFYVDGTQLATYENVTHSREGDSAYYESLSLAFCCKGAVADVDTDADGTMDTTAVDLTISNVHFSNGHTPAADDGDCTTDILCTDCGVVTTGRCGDHVSDVDDGNCVTPVYCVNPGCEKVFVEGHALTHVPKVSATNDATGTKEHWKCETEGCDYFGDLYLDEAGTQKVTADELVISKNFDVSGDSEKATVSEDYVKEAIKVAGEGDVTLNVPTTEIEIPAASMGALADAGNPLVITIGEGKVTLNPAAIAGIKSAAAENALSINVKKAGASVLQDAQTAALSTYSAIKEVITAEMFAANTPITTFGKTDEVPNTVTIEIPFVLASGTDAGDYMLVYVSDDGNTVEVIDNARFEDGKVTATLEHFSDYAIVYNGVEPQEPEVNGTHIGTNGGAVSHTVTGTYSSGGAAGATFSVDVEWGELSFEFQDAQQGKWNPATHKYEDSVKEGWKENPNAKVTIENHSDTAIDVTVSTENSSKDLGVHLNGDKSEVTITLPTAVGKDPDDEELMMVVTVTPFGVFTAEQDGDELATITVRIVKHDDNQN